jgi:Tol biopolymer transport system component
MRTAIVCGLLGALTVAIALAAGAASAKPPGVNGQITFGRFNPDLGDTQVYVVNPDGSHEHLVQGASDTGECPRWFSDGLHIATCGSGAPYGGSRIINPDDGTYRDVGGLDPALFNPCGLPSPDGSRLLCETFGEDGTVNGIHTIRSTDGGDLQRITSNPGGDDVPLDWSPEGKRIVFLRAGGESTQGLSVVNVNGTGLKQILPAGTLFTCCSAGWSPHGNEIVFSMHTTPDVHSSIWVVHSDGSGLHRVDVQPASACGGLNSDPSADGCFEPSWSPDGTKIVFAKGQNGDVDANIYTVNADGSGLTQVTHTGGSQSPDWGTHPLVH